MAWFKRKDKFIDLSGHYRRKQEKTEQIKQEVQDSPPNQTSSEGFFGIFGGSTPAPNSNSSESQTESYASIEDRKRKLAKRIAEMTTRLEEISNQIYHLQQRVEVLERKAGVSGY